MVIWKIVISCCREQIYILFYKFYILFTEAFARSDSGRTNTDMSEASTTDDYATATENNSDGSSRPQQQQPGTGSFESGSSLYSLTRTDATEEQQVCNGQVILTTIVDFIHDCNCIELLF